MQEGISRHLEQWKRDLEGAWREIPKAFRNEHSVRRTLQCHLFGELKAVGYRVVADYMPPRVMDRAVDLIVLQEDGAILLALCLETVVTLAAVKSLSSFESVHKVIFTMGLLEKKVQESRFFLKPDIQHVHLQPFEKPF